jgi:hypothetical protein
MGETVTLSYYIKASANCTINNRRLAFTNVTNGPTHSNLPLLSVTTGWQRVVDTVTLGSNSSAVFGATSYLDVILGLPVNTTVDVYITGVQLELGDTVTSFEHRSYGDELARCQRYYQKIGGPSYTGIGSGINFGTIARAISFNYLTEMRANPSGSIIGTLVVTDRTLFDTNVSSIDAFSPSTNSASIQVNKSANTGTNYYPIQLAVANSTTSYIALDAEL